MSEAGKGLDCLVNDAIIYVKELEEKTLWMISLDNFTKEGS